MAQFELIMPKMGESIAEATITKWLKNEGDTIKNLKFAETLTKISKFGPEAFYEGEIAKMIVNNVINSGGIMTTDDFKNYKSVWRDPIRFNYKDLERLNYLLKLPCM